MKFEFFDHTADVTMISVDTPNTDFGSNIFNLFMAEMIRVHGPSFKKLSDHNNGERGIALVYTHNITGVIKP